MIIRVHLIRYIRTCMEALQNLREDSDVANKGIVIPTEVRRIANPIAIRKRRQNREIAVSSVISDVKGSKGAQTLVKKGIEAAGVWYPVETYTSTGPDSWCKIYCVWGHIGNKCSSKPTCDHQSGYHHTTYHKCNVVGCTAKLGSLCSHMLEKCPNCKTNHIVFSSRCVKKMQTTEAAQHSSKIRLDGHGSTSAARDIATGSNRVAVGSAP